MYADENRLVMNDKELIDRLDRIEKSLDEIKSLIVSIPTEDYVVSGLVNVIANVVSEKIMGKR